ncbi:hypothetical protein, unknown function [Leishmania infantum JPCM5]|uniref:Uncharacterized protein n=2 Tax=Leishmania infantum TaxID=5671 RepID=A4I283_LEIIN|nr:hypothetical protein, unknown function [Leishmania infantum JPCM5]CAC9496888.1 hypothetical_protein_-_conserved [Leishmania infantum]CAM68870.1 hypothetical protein, unknown function [Leishmania infantum JPCM5]SUZ42739.1 hypothetical_protein_-_conserved [Leishmania infantum]|eukprot:XP_001470494.1 hypothetical protein, unknown function [Leishmania infantum JPCM5]
MKLSVASRTAVLPCSAPQQQLLLPPKLLASLASVLFVFGALCLVAASPFAAAATGASQMSKARRQATELLTHVTFASCNRQSRDQSFWMTSIASAIAAQCERAGGNSSKPHTDLLLWLGNAVYADVDEAGVARSLARPSDGVEQEYKLLTESTYYREFVEAVVGRDGLVSGIWDDRDLGRRGADGSYAQSEAIRRLYLAYIWKGHPLAVKDATGDGTPGALYSFNGIPAPTGAPLAAHFVHSVCTVTLDVRTQRTAPPNLVDALLRSSEETDLRLRGSKGAASDARLAEIRDVRARVMEADLLGRRQWAWLERTLATYLAPTARSPGDAAGRAHCAVTLIASPWQILLNDNKPFEGWDLYPASRSRLLLLLKKYKVERFVFLSGHAELGELGVMRRASKEDIRVEGPTATLTDSLPRESPTLPASKLLPPRRSSLVEVTSSGLTHTVREAPLVGWLAHWFTTSRMEEDAKSNGLSQRHLFLTRNTTMERQFGTVQVIGDRVAAARHADVVAASREEVLARTRVLITLHSVQRAGAPLVALERTLESLPSYAVEPLEEEEKEYDAVKAIDLYDAAHLPQFNVYNDPGYYPWLKRRMAAWQCAEVPCVSGQHFMLLKVIANLALAFAVVLVFLAAVYYYHLKHRDMHEEDGVKLKQD